MAARPYLAHAPHHSARSLAQRISPWRAHDHSAHGALQRRHGERHLRLVPATPDSSHHERAVANRDCLRTNLAYSLAALSRRGNNARLLPVGGVLATLFCVLEHTVIRSELRSSS